MLADAFAAERLRFFKARGTLFWSLGFVPVASILIAVIQALFVRAMTARFASQAGAAAAELARQPVLLLKPVLTAVSDSNFFLVQLFFLIGAAAIMAGDYRWETWRLLTPRNTRANLLLGKLATFGVLAAVGIALLAVAGLIGALLSAAITGSGVRWTGEGDAGLKSLFGLYFIAWMEMMVLGALATVIAIATRAGLAAMLVPVGVWIVQALALSKLAPGFADPMHPPATYILGFPALAADHLKSALTPAMPGFTPPTDWPLSVLALTLWIVALAALAVWLFQRQDFTRE